MVLNISSYNDDYREFVKMVRLQNNDLSANFSLTFYPKLYGGHGCWGFTTDNEELLGRITSQCSKLIEFTPD